MGWEDREGMGMEGEGEEKEESGEGRGGRRGGRMKEGKGKVASWLLEGWTPLVYGLPKAIEDPLAIFLSEQAARANSCGIASGSQKSRWTLWKFSTSSFKMEEQ